MAYNKATQLDPSNTLVFNCKGLVLSDLGMYQTAVVGFSKAVEIQPEYTESYKNKAWLYQL